MQLRELITAYRDRADDESKPYRADDPKVTAWLNEAVDEACVRADLIFDTTSPFCAVPVVIDQANYRLAPEIHKISAAWSTRFNNPLDPTDQSALDRAGETYGLPGRYRGGRSWARCDYWAQWRTQKGHPRFYLRDGQQLRLVPIPTSTDTLNLEVYRIPTAGERMKDAGDCPRIASAHHAGLVDWVLYRAYLRRDEDQNDPKLAAEHLGLFEARFGERPDANVMRKRQEHRSHTTAVNWP